MMLTEFLSILLPLMVPSAVIAGESGSDGLSVEGKVVVQADLHSRSGVPDSYNLLYLLPSRRNFNEVGMDLNSVYGSRFVARGAAVGLNYRNSSSGRFSLGAALEADLYFTGGSSTHILLKKACAGMEAHLSDAVSAGVKVGYDIHPMSYFAPRSLTLGAAAPFNPYGYAPQLTLWGDFLDMVRIGFSVLAPGEYPCTGPEGETAAYQRYSGIPEFLLETSVHRDAWRAGAGFDFIPMNPRYKGIYPLTEIEVVVGERMTAWAAYAEGGFRSRAGGRELDVRAKGIFNRGCTHINLLGGYCVSGLDEYYFKRSYSALSTLSAWVDVSYGAAFKVCAFGGYLRNLDASKSVPYPAYSYFTRGLTDLADAFRIGLGARYGWKRLELGLEYNYTGAGYLSGFTADHALCLNVSFSF